MTVSWQLCSLLLDYSTSKYEYKYTSESHAMKLIRENIYLFRCAKNLPILWIKLTILLILVNVLRSFQTKFLNSFVFYLKCTE